MAPRKRKTRKYYSKTKSPGNLAARRSFAVFLLLVLIGAILFGLYRVCTYTNSLFFSRNPRFELKRIEASSDGRLTPAKLIEYADLGSAVNLFDIDFKSVRNNLMSVSQIESVRLQRVLPATLVIQVAERVAVAQIQWTRRGLPLLVDRHGRVLPATRTGRSLPLIRGLKLEQLRPGEDVQDTGVLHVLAILAAADALGLGSQIQFEGFDLSYPDFITATLKDGASARFPYHSAKSKLLRLVVTLQKAQEMGKRVRTADLVPDGRNVPTTFY